jgi:ribosomal protein L37AE/L43A
MYSNADKLLHIGMMGSQHQHRQKYQRIRCPFCNATSNVVIESSGGWQDRKCKNGHYFHYSYTIEAVWQGTNYKCK